MRLWEQTWSGPGGYLLTGRGPEQRATNAPEKCAKIMFEKKLL